LPFPSVVATSDDDPLGNPVRVRALVRGWGSRLHPLGAVGHLNPASGYGDWPGALPLIAELQQPALVSA
jgi:predicted alpha/beta hydrolase family esterase